MPTPTFDTHSEAFYADPFPTLAAMRSVAPCWYDEHLRAHMLTRYDDIARVLRDDTDFSAARVAQFGHGAPAHMQDKLDVFNRALEGWLLFSDRPLHAALRRRLGRAFGVGQRPLVERSTRLAVARTLAALRDLGPAAEVDLVRDFAYPIPSTVLAGILGIPTPDIERFKRWTVDIFALIGAGVADAQAVEDGWRGVTQLGDYVRGLLDDRRRHPRDDVLGHLAAQGHDDGGDAADGEAAISDDDLVGLFMAMIVAGHETTTNLLANGLRGLLGDRRARDWVLVRGGVDDNVVDELIRHDGSVFSLIRRARRDVVLSGQTVRAGECVFCMLHAGNRDPMAFADPNRLRFDRPQRPAHLGLGLGLHACMGAAMARKVVGHALSEFLRAWPQAVVAPDVRWTGNLSIRGPLGLPCRLQGGLAASLPPAAFHDVAENRPRRIAGVQRACNTADVQAAVLAANRCGLPLYPVSTGKNWGVGSRSPVEDGCLLLELSGMNRVRMLDLDRGIVVIEPGVTQGALADRLTGTPFLLNVTTSCRDTSVVGNALDKGQGMLRLRDEDLLGLEVVLGNGDVATTGVLGPAGRGVIAELGAGPDATRLFCQSNFGVVTAAAIALVPRPERTAFAYATFAGAALPEVVDCVARLRRERVIGHIFNLGEMQIEPGRRARPDFTLLGPLLGRRKIVGEALDVVSAELAAVPGCKRVRTGDVEELAPADPLYHRGRTFFGIASCEPLQQRFGVASCDLDHRSTRGWSVVQTSLPLDGGSAADALEVLGACVDARGLPVQPHLSSVADRALNLMTMIGFQRDAQGIERMRGLRDELRTRLSERGFRPSREGIDALRRSSIAHDTAWVRLKAAFDPNGVIAPGRYVAVAPFTAGALAA